MPSPHRRHLASLMLACALIPAVALAQSEPPAVPASPGAEEALGRLEGMTEQLQTLQSDMDKLKRFKFSGYVQARYEVSETSSDSVKVAGSPQALTLANRDRFYLRRARVKVTYDPSSLTQAVVYLNGASSGNTLNLTLLEAYVTLLDPWTPDRRHQLTIGQMNVPFGWEIERSSSTRELPERSRAENVLFPGERDRGFKLVSQWTPRLETVIGAFNGGGPLDATFGTEDPTRGKEIVGRVRWSQGMFDAAVSGYGGQAVLPLTGPDATLDRTRFGADAQAYWELPSAGGGSLRGEWYSGTNPNADSIKAWVQAPTTANPVTLLKPGAAAGHLDTGFRGWYAMLVQNLGESAQLALRVDEYDPDLDVEHDQYRRFGAALHLFYDGTTRFTIAYDVPRTETAIGGGRYTDPDDNLWTFQMQLKY